MNDKLANDKSAYDKSARRNYVVFCGVSALFLVLAVLFASLVVAG
jgi:Flp pilus assembly protein TadB